MSGPGSGPGGGGYGSQQQQVGGGTTGTPGGGGAGTGAMVVGRGGGGGGPSAPPHHPHSHSHPSYNQQQQQHQPSSMLNPPPTIIRAQGPGRIIQQTPQSAKRGGVMPQQRGAPSGGVPPPGNPNNKKRRRMGDKIIPPQVRELVPESQAYMDLLAFEQKLDSTIARKRLDIQEALKRPMKVRRRLRIYVSHTIFPGKEPEKEGEDSGPPMWELRVEGRLLEDVPPLGGTPVGSGATPANPQPNAPGPAKSNLPNKKFSSFFKSLVIELDKDIYGPDSHLVEWHRTPQTKETDGFQVKRPGEKNVKCTILLLLDHQPMKFKLQSSLAKLLGVHTETRPKIIEALWQYVKTHKLQDMHERDHINCDQYLERILGCRRMRFMEIPQRLTQLLSQPDPIVINHMITCDRSLGAEPKKTACYDIDVEIEDPLKVQMNQFAYSQSTHVDIGQLDNKILEAVEQVKEMKTRRDFYLNFAEEPQEFIQKWLISQSQDLKTMTERAGEPEIERRSDFYHQPWLEEAVSRYFYNKIQQKRAELEQSLGVKNN